MTVRLQVVMDDEMAEGVRRAAESEDRSVSQWLRLLIEAELAREPALQERVDGPAKVNPKAAKLLAEPSVVEKASRTKRPSQVDCLHANTEKRNTATMGTRTFCLDCDRLLP